MQVNCTIILDLHEYHLIQKSKHAVLVVLIYYYIFACEHAFLPSPSSQQY